MDAIQRELLMQVAGLHAIPAGAYNIRSNGQTIDRKSTGNIEIINKPDKSGIEIHIKPDVYKRQVQRSYNFRMLMWLRGRELPW